MILSHYGTGRQRQKQRAINAQEKETTSGPRKGKRSKGKCRRCCCCCSSVTPTPLLHTSSSEPAQNAALLPSKPCLARVVARCLHGISRGRDTESAARVCVGGVACWLFNEGAVEMRRFGPSNHTTQLSDRSMDGRADLIDHDQAIAKPRTHTTCSSFLPCADSSMVLTMASRPRQPARPSERRGRAPRKLGKSSSANLACLSECVVSKCGVELVLKGARVVFSGWAVALIQAIAVARSLFI